MKSAKSLSSTAKLAKHELEEEEETISSKIVSALTSKLAS